MLIHCHSSISRSTAFILAYMMETEHISLVKATKLFKSKWDACWPADKFVFQLLMYEMELEGRIH
jgi:predicted protein tyrosine phosphatase